MKTRLKNLLKLEAKNEEIKIRAFVSQSREISKVEEKRKLSLFPER